MALFEKGFQAPSTQERSFNCPHCKALAQQFWYSTRVNQLTKDGMPASFTSESAASVGDDLEDVELRKIYKAWALKIFSGRPFLGQSHSDPYTFELNNVSVSKCYNCDDIAVWVGQKLVFPAIAGVAAPSADMPEDAAMDYREAAEIADASPRGAAALLRLAIQKICVSLGQSGKNINDDIAELVRQGLDPRIQKALDVVRVVGNNAVHPGELDIRDDRAIAGQLFGLLNLVVEIAITQPKHVAEIYDSLPAGARSAVARRDQK